MSRIRTLSILALVFLIAGMYFIKEGNGESRRPQSNDEIAKLNASVEKLKSDVKTLETKMETVPGFERYDKEQIGFLEENLKVLESYHLKMEAMFRVGTIASYAESKARFEVHNAKARLARGKGNLTLCQKEYEAALKAAEDSAKVWDALLENPARGMNPLYEVLRARSMVLEAKLSLSRVKKMIHQKQK